VSHDIKITTDLRSLFGPARDQGPRPTCLAFAASDTHAGLREGWAPLSCEFAFYHAQRRGLRKPSTGATLPHMLDALRLDGQPIEQGWPYAPVTPADDKAWAPPANPGPLFGRHGASSPASFDAVCAALDKGTPAMMLMSLSNSFYTPDAEGVVSPPPGELPLASVRHAVIAVAHGTVDGVHAVLVRNSWGAGWGLQGHAWLTTDFIKPRLFGLAVLGAEVDVPAYSVAA
jgi:hypothetical protein